MISKKVLELLQKKEFISVASCDFQGRPNAAPKFILKVQGGVIYLIDYVIGRTWQNLKGNPRVSLSFTDTETLMGYQINGPVELVEGGSEYQVMVDELRQKEIDLSTQRIIEGVTKGKVHENFELAMPDRFIIFKVHVEEVVELGSSGTTKREKI